MAKGGKRLPWPSIRAVLQTGLMSVQEAARHFGCHPQTIYTDMSKREYSVGELGDDVREAVTRSILGKMEDAARRYTDEHLAFTDELAQAMGDQINRMRGDPESTPGELDTLTRALGRLVKIRWIETGRGTPDSQGGGGVQVNVGISQTFQQMGLSNVSPEVMEEIATALEREGLPTMEAEVVSEERTQTAISVSKDSAKGGGDVDGWEVVEEEGERGEDG